MKKIVALALFCASLVFLAGNTSRLDGVVTDPTGAAVPGAEVRSSNLATGQTIKTTTSERGEWALPSMAAAEYKVSVTKAGFQIRPGSERHRQRRRTRIGQHQARNRCGQRNRGSRGRRGNRAGHQRGGQQHHRRTPTLRTSLRHPQRGGTAGHPSRRADSRQSAQLFRQRPAARRAECQHRRHEHPGQHAEVERRLLQLHLPLGGRAG